jgi:hypothetical protein
VHGEVSCVVKGKKILSSFTLAQLAIRGSGSLPETLQRGRLQELKKPRAELLKLLEVLFKIVL